MGRFSFSVLSGMSEVFSLEVCICASQVCSGLFVHVRYVSGGFEGEKGALCSRVMRHR
jgi:hypothetical protein